MRCGEEAEFVVDRQAMNYDGRNDFAVSGRMPPNVMDVMWLLYPLMMPKGSLSCS